MGKVVTSQGLTEFVQTGKFTNVPDHKPEKTNGAASVEVKPAVPVADSKTPAPDAADGVASPSSKEGEASATQASESADDDGLTEDERKQFNEHIRKTIGKKHRAMKEAQEAAAESDRFAETQFNERKLAEKRAEAAENRAKELEEKATPAKPTEPELKAPNIADFKDAQTGAVDWDKFTDAKADYAAKKAVGEERQRQAEERAVAEKTEAEKKMRARVDGLRKAHPDFDSVLDSVKGSEADQVPQFVLNYLFESDQGGELHYYLMKHPEESIRISKLTPIRGIAELGKLEAKLSPATPANTGSTPREAPRGAPAPITPLEGHGTAGVNTDPAKMSYKELRAYERARMREKH